MANGPREDVRVYRLAQVREADTLVVMINFADRDAHLEDDTYCLKEHLK